GVAEVGPVAKLDLPLTGYRSVEGSLGKQAVTMEAGIERIYRKLEERGAWKGHWLLRRKAFSYCRYSCAYLYGAAGNRLTALSRLASSFLWYPLPYRREEVRMPFAWPRTLDKFLHSLLRVN